MKGKGFIYISPDNGPLKFNIKEKLPNPWSQGDGGILHKVLVHELGHVFGIPHTSAESTRLMTEDFPERMISDTGSFDQNINFLKRFFGHNKISEDSFCDLKKEEKEFLNIKSETKCIGFKYSGHTSKLHLHQVENGVFKELIYTLRFGRASFGRSTIVRIWLPKEQKVFPSNRQVLYAHGHHQVTAFGRLPFHGPVNKTFYVNFNPGSETIIFFSNGYQEFELGPWRAE